MFKTTNTHSQATERARSNQPIKKYNTTTERAETSEAGVCVIDWKRERKAKKRK